MASYGFDKHLRLLTASHYQTVFDHVELKAGSKHFLLLAQMNHQDHARLGLVIAKKHVRTAVARNQIKRIVRESFRLHQHELQGMDIIVLAKKGAASLDKPAIHKVMVESWRRLKQRSLQRQQNTNGKKDEP